MPLKSTQLKLEDYALTKYLTQQLTFSQRFYLLRKQLFPIYGLDIIKVGLGNQNCVHLLCRLVQYFHNASTLDSKPKTPSLEYLQK